MLKTFFKTTLRGLWKNKGYSFLNIFGLAIGIACAGLIFLWVEDEVTFDDVNTKKDNLYALRVNMKWGDNTFTNASTPHMMALTIKDEIPGIANACRAADQNINSLFSTGDKKLYSAGLYADSSLFTMFTLPFVKGNAQAAFNQLYSIVLTEKTAKKFFGNEEAMGKTLRIDNKQDLVVTGILKDMPANSTLQFEWVAPMEFAFRQGMYDGGWNSYGPLTYVELNNKANLQTINKQLYNYIHGKDASQNTHAFLFPMKDWHLYGEFQNGKQTGGGRIEQVRLLSIIAWIILLIACINFMNLSTARSEKKAKEVGVRKVLGSGKKRLVIAFIGEAVCMAALAAIIAVLLMLISLPAFNQLVHKQLSLALGNPVHLLALLAIIVICGLVAGSYPSLYLSSFNPIAVLKGLKIKTGSAAYIRKGLVVLQFTVSVVFIISTIIVYQQVQFVKNRKLGFNKDNLVEIAMQHDVTSIFPTIKQHLLTTGVIENAAIADHSMLYGGDTDGSFDWQGKTPGSSIDISFREISPEFLHTYGLHIKEGRDFTTNVNAEGANIIINQTLANLMGEGSAVGKIVQSHRGEDSARSNLTVVGVVDDYVFGGMYGNPGPAMFFCRPPRYDCFVYARLKQQTDVAGGIAKIEAVMKKDNPAYPLQYRFVDDQFNEMFVNEMQMSKISAVFATLAIIISCLGLFGLAAYTAERRVKEIGIRKVLGASVTGLAGLLSKDFLQLVGLSCLLSFPIAGWIMHNWLQQYEYRMAMDWWIFAMAGVLAIVIAAATVSFQAVKAAVANPVMALRAE